MIWGFFFLICFLLCPTFLPRFSPSSLSRGFGCPLPSSTVLTSKLDTHQLSSFCRSTSQNCKQTQKRFCYGRREAIGHAVGKHEDLPTTTLKLFLNRALKQLGGASQTRPTWSKFRFRVARNTLRTEWQQHRLALIRHIGQHWLRTTTRHLDPTAATLFSREPGMIHTTGQLSLSPLFTFGQFCRSR